MATTQHAQTRSDFSIALNQIATERNIDAALVLSSIEEAIVAAYRRTIQLPQKKMCFSGDRRAHRRSKSLSSSRQKAYRCYPSGFGRIAANSQTGYLTKSSRAERDAVIKLYTTKIGTIVTGMVLRHDGKNVIMDIGKGQATAAGRTDAR